jgi:hypothetical protein
VFGIGLALTSSALAAMHWAVATPSRAIELAVLVAANLTVTVLRFLALRGWVFHPGRTGGPAGTERPAIAPDEPVEPAMPEAR